MIHPVILCGGTGTRLWPSSRQAYPKQFSALLGDYSSFQDTLRRVAAPAFAAPLLLTVEPYRFLVEDQMRSLGLSDAEILLEPEPRNTGPAVLTAALRLAESDPDIVMLVLPSDHLIRDATAFLATVERAVPAAEAVQIVTFGISPNRPETGFGYLELAGPADKAKPVALTGFHEKPDLAMAEALLAKGHALWNAGIFLFRARTIIAAYEQYASDLVAPCREALAGAESDLAFIRLASAPYETLRSVSIDDAVMEKAEGLVALPLDAGWLDLGSWDALQSVLPADANGVVGSGQVTAINCENSILRSEDSNVRLVGLGLKNIAAIAMRDAVLVADLSQAQQVGQVVAELKAAGATQAEDYPRFHRPWGWYETLCLDTRFQVKRIMVKPGGLLSLQSHVHRSEHWVVVSGTARVTVGDKVQLLGENESVYIPLGAVHRMENPGKVPMYLIEVQTGAYLGEDDIVRYEDIYSRA